MSTWKSRWNPRPRPSSPLSLVRGTAEKVDDAVKPTAKPSVSAEPDGPSTDQAEMPLPSDLSTAFQGGSSLRFSLPLLSQK
jgi:hypothetical protein